MVLAIHLPSGGCRPLANRGKHVLIHAAAPHDLVTESLAVARQAGEGAVLTGPSSIAVQGLARDRLWREVDLGSIAWITCERRLPPGSRVIRRAPPRSVTAYGVRVARERDAWLDMVRLMPADEARALADRAAQVWGSGEVVAILTRALDWLGGAAGVPRLKAFAESLGSNAHSEAERRLIAIVREAGLAGWRANAWVTVAGHRFVADLLFEEARVIVEVDGRAWHGLDRQNYDAARQNRLTLAGWRVLRFDWWAITEEPERVIAEIIAALGYE